MFDLAIIVVLMLASLAGGANFAVFVGIPSIAHLTAIVGGFTGTAIAYGILAIRKNWMIRIAARVPKSLR